MMLLTQPNTLSEQQCRELQEFKTTTKKVKLYRRAKVILYRNAGYTPDEIEEHTEYSEREQRYLVRRYREKGVRGLYDRPRSGRPKHTSDRRSGEADVHEAGKQDAERPFNGDITQTVTQGRAGRYRQTKSRMRPRRGREEERRDIILLAPHHPGKHVCLPSEVLSPYPIPYGTPPR